MARAATLASDLALALDPARLMVACGLPPDPWQAQALRTASPRALWLCCRQSGKSTLAAVLALHMALYQPDSLTLLLSPSLRQSQELFKKVLDVYRALGNAVPLQAESALRLETVAGSRIVSLPATESTIRGYSGVDLLVIDEAARVPDSLYFATRPMLAVSGGKLVALSTPWGKRGWFYEAWEFGDNWERTRLPARECPRIPASFLGEEQRTLPLLWYQSEYECIFGDTVNSVFRQEDIDEMFAQGVTPMFPEGI
jgi:hypothetical protein